MELEALQESLDAIERQGASLITICPQTLKERKRLTRKLKLSYPVLGDPGNKVAATYGLRHKLPEDLQKLYIGFGADLTRVNGEDSWTLPLPARYVIDTDGTILKADVNVDYRYRPEPSETLDFLKGLP